MDILKDIRKKNWFYLENNLIDRLDLSIYEKMSYTVLARHSNADGLSFPSYKTLALKMGCSERKAKETIASLITKNLIAKENRVDKETGSYTSNIYLIKDVPSACDAQGVVHEVHEGSACDAQKGNSFKETHLKETKLSIYSDVIDYLNLKAKTNYKPSSSQTKAAIDARVKDGFVLDDFKSVVDVKVKEWLNTDFEKYLRPSTLFGSKFESYLNQKGAKSNASTGTSVRKNTDWEQSELEKAKRIGNTDYSSLNF